MADPVLQKLGHRVRTLRQAKSLSQERLAELTRLHRTYIGGIERGERNIGFLNLVRLARALDVSLATLVEDVDFDLPL